MSEKFIQSEKAYIAAKYSKKKIGIGIGGQGAMMFIAPRAGEDFDEQMLYTIELMRHANIMYDMLSALLPQLAGSPAALKINRILAKARGER